MLFPQCSLKKGGDQPIPPTDVARIKGYKEDVPVFFGHYWLKSKNPESFKPQTGKICCLDYSIAKNGWLVAYTWDGEESLANKKFTWVKYIERH